MEKLQHLNIGRMSESSDPVDMNVWVTHPNKESYEAGDEKQMKHGLKGGGGKLHIPIMPHYQLYKWSLQ